MLLLLRYCCCATDLLLLCYCYCATRKGGGGGRLTSHKPHWPWEEGQGWADWGKDRVGLGGVRWAVTIQQGGTGQGKVRVGQW